MINSSGSPTSAVAELTEAPEMKRRGGKWVVAVLGLGLLAAGGWRLTQRAKAHERAQPHGQPPSVRVVSPVAAPDRVSLTLAGSLRPREHVVLYARTNGFLREWKVDLGDAVKKGQVLARIDAPEISANLVQARARREQARASIVLVKGQHERTTAMASSGTLSPQDVDASALRLAAAQSELSTAEAEVDRLSSLVGYQTVTAPFDGTVTRRHLDNGALVTSGATALFELASTNDLRVEVDVPQWLASQIQPGTPAKVSIGKSSAVLEAEVSRTSGALDPVLRTLSVQLLFKSPTTTVVPGSYARVTFEAPRGEPALQLPGATVAVRDGVPMVGVVRADGTLRFLPVQVIRDLGRNVELQGDLQPEMKVALYPPAALADGDRVTPVEGKP